MGYDNQSINRGLNAFKSQDYATAVSELEQATIVNHEDFQAFLYLGAAYAGAGRTNAAIGAFKKAAEIKPEDARAHYNLGQAYEAAGVPREALFEYARALRINPYYSHAREAFTSLRSRTAAQRGRKMQLRA